MRALVLAFVGACAADEIDPSTAPRDPAADGPWQVGVMTVTVPDPTEANTSYDVEIWYPARPAADALPDVQLSIEGRAVRGAPPDHRGAPFPVIGFSHGSGGIRFQSIYLTEQLASHGYVVVAPDHRHNTLSDDDSSRRAQVLRRRPHAVREAIDLVIDATDELAGMGDPTRIGVAGHSFGAFTALVLAGARVDLEAVRAACAAREDDRVCQALDASLTQADFDGFVDVRVRAALALAPAGRIAFGDTGLGAVRAPIAIHAGTLDTYGPLATEAQPIADGIRAETELVVIEGAAHFSFTNICPLYTLLGGATGPLDFLATEGCGTNTSPVVDVHAESRARAVEFFDRHVRER